MHPDYHEKRLTSLIVTLSLGFQRGPFAPDSNCPHALGSISGFCSHSLTDHSSRDDRVPAVSVPWQQQAALGGASTFSLLVSPTVLAE